MRKIENKKQLSWLHNSYLSLGRGAVFSDHNIGNVLSISGGGYKVHTISVYDFKRCHILRFICNSQDVILSSSMRDYPLNYDTDEIAIMGNTMYDLIND